MAVSVYLFVGLSVCLFIHDRISGTTRLIYTKFLAHVTYGWPSVL